MAEHPRGGGADDSVELVGHDRGGEADAGRAAPQSISARRPARPESRRGRRAAASGSAQGARPGFSKDRSFDRVELYFGRSQCCIGPSLGQDRTRKLICVSACREMAHRSDAAPGGREGCAQTRIVGVADVCNGSKAEVTASPSHVRSYPNNRHASVCSPCPLSARSGHLRRWYELTEDAANYY